MIILVITCFILGATSHPKRGLLLDSLIVGIVAYSLNAGGML